MESVCGVAHGSSFSAESGLQAIKEVTEDGLFFYLLGSPAIPAGRILEWLNDVNLDLHLTLHCHCRWQGNTSMPLPLKVPS